MRHIDWNVTARLDEPLRAPVHRGPRAHRVAAARPLARRWTSAPRGAARTSCSPSWRSRWPGCSPAAATASARCSSTSRSSGSSRRAAAAPTCCGWPTSCGKRRRRRAGTGTTTDLAGAAARRAGDDPPAVARVPRSPTSSPAPAGSGRWPGSPQRHEVVAIRLVDPLERELPDVGLIVVEDAETGEQVARRHQRPGVPPAVPRRGRRPRGGAAGVDLAGSGVRLNDVSTDDDLADALVGMVRRSTAAAAMTFIWPSLLGALVLVPAIIAGLRLRCSAGGRGARGALGASGLVLSGGRRAGSGRRRHLPFAVLIAALAVMIFALSRPQATLATLAADRHGAARRRRVQQHGRRRRRRRPGSPSPSRRRAGFVQAQPSTIEIGARRLRQRRAGHAAADRQPRRRARGHRPAEGRRGAPRSARGCSLALSTIAGTPVALPDPQSDAPPPSIGYFPSATMVLLSDGENTGGPDPIAVAQLAVERRRARLDDRRRHDRGRGDRQSTATRSPRRSTSRR